MTRDERELAAVALRVFAASQRRKASGHANAGRTFKQYRAVLRAEAGQAEALARKLDSGS